jgi:deoxyribonuclease (pyrimidine dimer)
MDQHLFAEFREIKMVPKSLRRSIAARGPDAVVKRIPPRFTLNTGHVSFFYNKGAYLVQRYAALRAELEARGINFNRESPLDPDGTMQVAPWNGSWEPDDAAFHIIRTRIAEKIAMKPSWYRYTRKD